MKDIIQKLKARGACKPAMRYLKTHTDFIEAWEACNNSRWLRWVMCSYDIPLSFSVFTYDITSALKQFHNSVPWLVEDKAKAVALRKQITGEMALIAILADESGEKAGL